MSISWGTHYFPKRNRQAADNDQAVVPIEVKFLSMLCARRPVFKIFDNERVLPEDHVTDGIKSRRMLFQSLFSGKTGSNVAFVCINNVGGMTIADVSYTKRRHQLLRLRCFIDQVSPHDRYKYRKAPMYGQSRHVVG